MLLLSFFVSATIAASSISMQNYIFPTDSDFQGIFQISPLFWSEEVILASQKRTNEIIGTL